MPSGEIQYEVQEVINSCDDADNVRWYEVRWDDGSISWILEKDSYNCWERVKDYLAKNGLLQDWGNADRRKSRRKLLETYHCLPPLQPSRVLSLTQEQQRLSIIRRLIR